jgi:PAS domain S-box-containing protein
MTEDLEKSHGALQQSASEWKTTFDSITDLVCIVDQNFTLLRVNKAFADTFSMKPEELVGKKCYQMIHGTNEPVPGCPHIKTLEIKESAIADFFEPHLGLHIEQATSPIFNEKGEVVASTHITRDITQRKLAEEERLSHQKVAQELATAWRIQASFLPDELPRVAGWQLAATLKPARETSGDFYDVIPLPGGRLGILIADVADKGVGAALYMALARTLIRTYAVEYESKPELVLSAANRRLLTDIHFTMFVTVFYGILDLATGTLMYCNAGHNPPYLLSGQNGDTVHALRRTGIALGVFENMTWKQESVQLAIGDVLLLYTDGITEAQDPQGLFFGDTRWLETVQDNRGRSAQEIQDALIEEVHEFVGDVPQFDDIALMVVVRGLSR